MEKKKITSTHDLQLSFYSTAKVRSLFIEYYLPICITTINRSVASHFVHRSELLSSKTQSVQQAFKISQITMQRSLVPWDDKEE
jgi:hypothetical protein